MAKEGSAADKREDTREAKKRGMSMKRWENSAADKKQDAAATRKRSAPMPGQNEFTPKGERLMRQGQRNARMAPPPMPDGDEDDALA
jgi:hypothetical protein